MNSLFHKQHSPEWFCNDYLRQAEQYGTHRKEQRRRNYQAHFSLTKSCRPKAVYASSRNDVLRCSSVDRTLFCSNYSSLTVMTAAAIVEAIIFIIPTCLVSYMHIIRAALWPVKRFSDLFRISIRLTWNEKGQQDAPVVLGSGRITD